MPFPRFYLLKEVFVMNKVMTVLAGVFILTCFLDSIYITFDLLFNAHWSLGILGIMITSYLGWNIYKFIKQ